VGVGVGVGVYKCSAHDDSIIISDLLKYMHIFFDISIYIYIYISCVCIASCSSAASPTSTSAFNWRMQTYADVCWRMLNLLNLLCLQGFMFCRRKSYKDLRIDRDSPEGIEVPWIHTSAYVSIRQHTSAYATKTSASTEIVHTLQRPPHRQRSTERGASESLQQRDKKVDKKVDKKSGSEVRLRSKLFEDSVWR
jgi:hypothetical protein